MESEIVEAIVNHSLNQRKPFYKALLLQRCMEGLKSSRTWRFQSYEVSRESKPSRVQEPSAIIPNSPQESKSSRVQEPPAVISNSPLWVTREKSVKLGQSQ